MPHRSPQFIVASIILWKTSFQSSRTGSRGRRLMQIALHFNIVCCAGACALVFSPIVVCMMLRRCIVVGRSHECAVVVKPQTRSLLTHDDKNLPYDIISFWMAFIVRYRKSLSYLIILLSVLRTTKLEKNLFGSSSTSTRRRIVLPRHLHVIESQWRHVTRLVVVAIDHTNK